MSVDKKVDSPRSDQLEARSATGVGGASTRRDITVLVSVDPTALEAEWAMRLIRSGGMLVIAFQSFYLAEDLLKFPQMALALLPFHCFNLLIGVALTTMSWTEWFRRHWRSSVLVILSSLLASTTAICALEARIEPLFVSMFLVVIGTGMLAPWSASWQVALELVGAGSLAAGSLVAASSPYHWLGLITVIGLAHCSVALGQHNRENLSKHLTALGESEVRLAEKLDKLGQTERRARQSEAKLRRLFDAASETIVVSRISDGAILDTNKEFAQKFGLSKAEALGSSMLGLWVEPAAREEFIRQLRALGAVSNAEARFRTRDGQELIMLFSAAQIELDGEACIIGVAHDITGRKRTEQQLREREEMLRRVFESSPDPITINRYSDGKYVYLNREAATSGYAIDETVGRTPEAMHFWNDRLEFEHFLELLRSEGQVRNLEVVFRNRTGAVMPCLVSATVVELNGERCIVSFVRDITELKEVETQLKLAREEALAAARAKSEFLSNMSHEIRTPLNAILGMADILWESSLSQEQQRYLGIMRTNGDALLNLINDILDLAKIESGRLSMERSDFELEKVVVEVAEVMAVRAHEKGLELAVRIAPDVPRRLLGDPFRLRQILVNLVGNGVKFTERGHVIITVERAAESAEPGIAGQGAGGVTLRFSVLDTGTGIPSDQLGRLFSNFVQGDSTTTRKYGGSGLGLAIVKRLVSLYGGEIQAESEVGRGSCFSFTAKFGVGQAQAEPRLTPTLDLKGMRVLAVDDIAVNRLIVREVLAAEGAEVGEADSASSALTEFERARRAGTPYRLMIVDYRMPGMNGVELVNRLRELGYCDRGSEMIIVMLTSDDLAEQVARLHQCNIDVHLVKPVRRSELLAAVARALGRLDASAERRIPARGPSPTSVAGLRILLADDSPDNRLLVRKYLEKSGCEVVEADDGAAALQVFKAGKYDAVLMDMKMPVVDGEAATRAIRAWEKATGRVPTPIIALTASTLQEDIRRSLEAGCDLHVAKPVRRQALIEAIDKLASAVQVRASGAQDQPNGWPAAGLEQIDPELRDLLPGFLEQKRVALDAAQAALARGDVEVANRVGHQLKGEGGAYGFEAVSEMGQKLEDAAARGDREAALRWTAELAAFIGEARAQYPA